MKKINKAKVRNSFKDKKFKYGGYATLMTAFVLAILVVINLVVGQIPFKIDLTDNRMFSLSDQTEKLLKELDQKVRIIGLYRDGQEERTLDEILQRYKRGNKNITVEYIDPVKNPTFSAKYTTDGTSLREGTFIVEADDRYKAIDYLDLYNLKQDQYGNVHPESLALEERITGAIQYVTADEIPVVYVLEGHGEWDLPMETKKQMELENYEVKSLRLLTEGKVPDDAALLMITAPTKDITEGEEQMIRDYLDGFGKAMFLMDIVLEDMPHFDALLKSYGVGLNKALTLEGDKSQYFQTPNWIVPNLEDHEILSPMKSKKLQVLAFNAQGIEELELKKRSTEIVPLLTTSDSAWGKVDLSSTNPEKEPGDLEGPFNIAVAVVDKEWDSNAGKYNETKLVVVGDVEFLNPRFAGVGNSDFLMNSLNWLQDKKESISIRPKSLMSEYLTINPFQQLLLSGVAVILIPLLILGAGLFMWLKRRHL